MSDSPWTWSLHERIPSTLPIAHQYLDIFNRALQDSGWDGRDLFHVQMASEEALVNAVTHGNKQDGNKHVEIELRVSPDRVYMRFKDEGNGFCLDKVPDPREDSRLECVHGRGVLLIRQMMSEVHYHGCGNEVEMLKRRHESIPLANDEDEDDDDDVFGGGHERRSDDLEHSED
ncbi:MAG: ATP-binding protein [Pirellulaceae bacterium]|nr:ATP-binding protein [Pirellulaceae bacterium]